jgi:hypothetical protein
MFKFLKKGMDIIMEFSEIKSCVKLAVLLSAIGTSSNILADGNKVMVSVSKESKAFVNSILSEDDEILKLEILARTPAEKRKKVLKRIKSVKSKKQLINIAKEIERNLKPILCSDFGAKNGTNGS